MPDGKSNTYKIIGGGNTAVIGSRKSTMQYDDLSSDSSSDSYDDLSKKQYFNAPDDKILRQKN